MGSLPTLAGVARIGVPVRRAVLAAGVIGALAAAPAAQIVRVDDSGVRLALAAPAGRIVSLAPSNTESIFAIGAGDLLVGATRFADYPAEALRLPRVGGYSDIDIERVIELRPDLVLATGFQAGGIVPRLRGLGLPVFVVEPRDVAEVLDRLVVLGELVGRRDEAERVAASLSARLRQVDRRVQASGARPRVLFILSRDLFVAGPGSFAHDLIRRAGGENIAADLAIPYPQISEEAVIARDPQVILVGGHQIDVGIDELRRRPGWSNISAVRDHRVFVFEQADLASRPGPRVIDALEVMARFIGGTGSGSVASSSGAARVAR